ncbi:MULTISPECIES: sensor histidine kinase [Neobacillus]|uniref:sensor histidine kinase n=1 Tax=Neobacillus TaxID=2675232 RepID=UPI0013D6B16A|nr:sensor histidine kinase [Neobacillus sedimentimangrovi]
MNIKYLSKNELLMLVAMVILVPLAGEIKFYPFNDIYRVSFGPPALFLFLLWLRKVPTVFCGLLTGLSVLIFRMILDGFHPQPFDWINSLQANFPSFSYYVAYSLVFFILKIHRYNQRPWVIGVLGIFNDFAAGLIELTIEVLSFGTFLTLDAIYKIFIIAIFRSFFVIGFFSTMKFHDSKLREAEMKKRNEHMMLLISNLYADTILLKKSLQHAEEVTKQSYSLYKVLQELKQGKKTFTLNEIPQQALRIAGEVHEIKKDNQRILSGLTKLISDENLHDYLDIESLFKAIIRSNKNYAELLGKNIHFYFSSSGSHPPYHVYTFISIINNLVANSVEAIMETGKIILSAEQQEDWLTIRIEDDGPGIPPSHKEVIFKPGFTLKFDSTGKSSTGIGLTYVKEVVEMLDGKVTLDEPKNGSGAIFIIRLPIEKLTRKGD